MVNDFLITYFDAFDGREKNNSELIAKLLAELNTKHTLELFQLKTHYDTFFKLKKHIEDKKLSSRWIISLGESNSETIKYETIAYNQDDCRVADNNDVIRKDAKINHHHPGQLEHPHPIFKDKEFKTSTDPGRYVCNNTFFHGLTHYGHRYFFIHVPKTDLVSEKSNQAIAREILNFMTILKHEYNDTSSV